MTAAAPLRERVLAVTDRIHERSVVSRATYPARMGQTRRQGTARGMLPCTNLARGFTAGNPGAVAQFAGDVTGGMGSM